jgi:hypothetical protein
MVAPLITGCGGEEGENGFSVQYSVEGMGTIVNIEYIDSEGVTQNVNGYNPSVSGIWESTFTVNPGANLYLSATDVSGSAVWPTIRVGDNGGSREFRLNQCTTAWVSYAVPSDAGTQNVEVEYRVLGSDTAVAIDYIDFEGDKKSIIFNLNANSNRWDHAFNSDSGAPLALWVNTGTSTETIMQIFIGNQQVLHGELDDVGSSSSFYVVP